MISEDTPPNGTAITIESIIGKLKEWSIPYQIAPGAGRIIIGEVDRPNYLLGDAVASISILLPLESPHLKPFIEKTKADIKAFASANPTYDNQRPRELFYASYSDQGGRRVPDSVTIYTDSPYWPSYSEFPLVMLVTRIQSTSLHFYRSPIDPKAFDPNSPASDLTMSFGMNWVKYTTPERHSQAEQVSGRLELEYSMSNNTFEQFGWNLKSKKSSWATNGDISSLLDLRGAQLIISTVIGNAGNRDENLKAAFAEVRALTKLNYINLSLGIRSIEFDNRNTRRFLDKNGNPYYVFDFPRTSQEMLKVFKP